MLISSGIHISLDCAWFLPNKNLWNIKDKSSKYNTNYIANKIYKSRLELVQFSDKKMYKLRIKK